jgi:integrase
MVAEADTVATFVSYRGDAKGPMFYRVRKLGKVVVARMTPHAIYDIVQRRAREAKVERFSPHDLRRTFAGDMFDLGGRYRYTSASDAPRRPADDRAVRSPPRPCSA